MLRRTPDLEVANDLPAQSDIPHVDGIVLCIDLDYNSVDAAQILGRLSINNVVIEHRSPISFR